MKISYRKYNSGESQYEPKQWESLKDPVETPAEAIFTALALLGDSPQTDKVAEVLIYDGNQLVYRVKSNTYSDGQNDFIITPIKEEQ